MFMQTLFAPLAAEGCRRMDPTSNTLKFIGLPTAPAQVTIQRGSGANGAKAQAVSTEISLLGLEPAE